jgi:hypothetical protein
MAAITSYELIDAVHVALGKFSVNTLQVVKILLLQTLT